MGNVVKYFLTLCFLTGSCLAQGGECPQGWAKWKDEKCYLLETTYSTYTAAKEVCIGNGGYLATIKEEEQQTFLTNFIFNISEVKMGVWIGAIRISGSETEFKWDVDGSNLEHTNWGSDSPTPIIGRDCVAMQSRFSTILEDEEELDGKWKDVLCEAPNYFVCETVPSWSMDEIRRVLIETRKNLETTTETLSNQIIELEEKLAEETQKVENIQRNPVPVGFIYYEHHGQPAPQTLWPLVTWKDVTSTYAGLFFRALGGGSAAFGSTQNEDSPKLSKVETAARSEMNVGVIDISPGAWSPWLFSGRSQRPADAHRYYVSNPEVRPKNAAIKIWKREA